MPRKKVAATKPPASLTFVVSTDNVDKPDAQLRRFIRSHVMQGKNLGKKLPPRKKRGEPTSDDSSPSSGEDQAVCLLHEKTTFFAPTIPRWLTASMSTTGLADSVEPGSLDVILQFSSIAKKVLFTLEPCILFEHRAEQWIGPLTFDPVYLHCLIFTSQYFFDAFSARRIGIDVAVNQKSMPHYIKAVRLLRDRLNDEHDEIRLSNTTAAAVMGLSGYALVTQDLEFAELHIKGLFRIMALRGGTETFSGNEKLLVEILRCDLGLALSRGSRPLFHTITEADKQLLQYPDMIPLLATYELAATDSVPDLLDGIHDELAQAWISVSDFSTLINFAAETTQRITTHTFLHIMTSVMYRLMSLDYSDSPWDEIIRLGLLAFSASVFLQWRSVGMSYQHLTSVYRKRLSNLMEPRISSKTDLWLMMVGAVSLFNEKDDWWLRPVFLFNLDKCCIKSWDDMRDLMHEFLWIDLVHDKPGRTVFERLSAGS